MMEGQIISLLKQEQANFALEALLKPANCNDFEYGYRCGVTHGIEFAINKIINLVTQEEEK